jgi:O-antigen/teichoic acid export membrane protein
VSRLLKTLDGAQEKKEPGHSHRQVANGIISAIGGRGVAVVVNFFSVPLTVKYLGAELYGVWITLTSILAYLTVLDLGIGSTAINGISEALANKDFLAAKRQINSAYWTLSATAALIALGVFIAWPRISWSAVLGAKSGGHSHEITLAAAIAVAIVVVGFPLSVTPRIMGACHKVTLSNLWNSIGSVASLLAILLATHLRVGLPGLVLAISGASFIVGICSTVWLYHHFDWLTPDLTDIKWATTRQLLSAGLPFFAVQISGVILFQTDNLIIAQVLGAKAVTPYSITWKLFSYATLLQVIALPSLWPAYADAFARRSFSWIRKTYRYNLLIAMGSTAIFVFVLIFCARSFIAVWAGSAAVPTLGLVAAMGVWTLISSLSWCQSCLLGAAGQVKGQAIYSALGAIVNIFSSIIFGRLFGLIGIVMGTLAAYLFCIIVPQTIEVHKLLKGRSL